MMQTVLILLNAVSSLAVFICAVCHLTRRQWRFEQPEMWAHVLLIGGSIAAAASSLKTPASAGQTLLVFGCAVYFVTRGWRTIQFEGKHHD